MSTYTKFSHLSLAAKIKRAKNLQVKYFTGENILIYGVNGFAGDKLVFLHFFPYADRT